MLFEDECGIGFFEEFNVFGNVLGDGLNGDTLGGSGSFSGRGVICDVNSRNLRWLNNLEK
jgi:hypothetical protein